MLPLQGTWVRSLVGELRTGVLSGVANNINILGPTEGFPGISVVKNLPAMHETWVQPLDWEDPLEKEMATHSSILAWRISWTEEPGGLYSPWDHKRVVYDLVTKQEISSPTRKNQLYSTDNSTQCSVVAYMGK